METIEMWWPGYQLRSLSLEFIEGGGAGESEGEEFGEATEGLFEILEREGLADKG